MKIHDVEQGSVGWANLRAGIATASDFDQLVTPLGKVRTGETPHTFLAKKLAEWWTGGALAEFATFDMTQGQILEEHARPAFNLITGLEARKIGFITDDSGSFGCSPDGWLGNRGVEIKCPMIHTHVKWLLHNELPPKHLLQVQGSMFVTGAKTWEFMSYCRKLPELMITVERDDAIQSAISEALALFLAKMESGKAHMIQLNGGVEPKRYSPFPQQEAKQMAIETADIIL